MWVAQAVETAARLGIADALAQSQPQDSTTLARAVGADARALARLLRALASLGVLAESLPQQYTLTPVGELLRSDIPDSMRDWLIAETDTPHWQAWGQLYEGVRSGQTVVPQLFGMHIYEYYAAHPEDRACFSRAMDNISAAVRQSERAANRPNGPVGALIGIGEEAPHARHEAARVHCSGRCG